MGHTSSTRAKWRALRSARSSTLKKHLTPADIVRDAWFLLIAVGLVQIIPTCIGYTDVKAGEPSLRSFPVLAELLFPAHGLLRFAQRCLMLTKTIPWSIKRPI